MCYRYEVEKESDDFALAIADSAEQLKYELNIAASIHHVNGFSHPPLPVITMDQPDKVQQFNWGLIPSFIKSELEAVKIQKMTLNAKSETIFEKPSFKHSIMSKRCLIPATGFFEWHTIGKEKFPFYISYFDNSIYCFGGIYSQWLNKATGQVHNTFSIVTCHGNEMLNEIHNEKMRIPLIFEKGKELEWLNPALDRKALENIMQPINDKFLKAYPIGKLITSKGNANVKEVKERVNYPELGDLNYKWAA